MRMQPGRRAIVAFVFTSAAVLSTATASVAGGPKDPAAPDQQPAREAPVIGTARAGPSPAATS